MSNIVPPKYVMQVLLTLSARGYAAYLVGGCVRDMLMGVHPQDWDVCTSALPEEVIAVFPRSLPTGISHGTVTVRVNSRSVEVTTFRTEGGYSDHRHPDDVSFVGDLTSDLSRRDFTMNAIAVQADGLMSDPFGGVDDIKRKIIRCVGYPELRFEEDALRMFRALRFSARLGFTIEEQTYAAIGKKAALAAGLSAERVRDELEKTLLTPSPGTVFTLIGLGLLDKYLVSRIPLEAEGKRLSRLPRKALTRWAGLCMLLDSSGSIRSTEEFLLSLRLDSRTVRCCADAAEIFKGGIPSRTLDWKRLLNRYGVDTVTCFAQCSDALLSVQCYSELKSVLKSGECFSVKYLAVTGDDLLELGIKGRALGEMLNFLLDYVMEYPENNRRELLLSLASNSEES